MNKYQERAFIVFVTLVLALLLESQLDRLVIASGVIFLMTLVTTWLVVFSGIQVIGFGVKSAGRGVAHVGRTVQDGSANIKTHLRASVVPSRDDLASASVDEDEGIPLIDDAMDYQNDDGPSPAS